MISNWALPRDYHIKARLPIEVLRCHWLTLRIAMIIQLKIFNIWTIIWWLRSFFNQCFLRFKYLRSLPLGTSVATPLGAASLKTSFFCTFFADVNLKFADISVIILTVIFMWGWISRLGENFVSCFVDSLFYELWDHRHDQKFRQVTENWVTESLRPFQAQLFCHDILLPDFHKVFLIEYGDFALDLSLEESFYWIKLLTFVLKEIHNVTTSEFGICFWG